MTIPRSPERWSLPATLLPDGTRRDLWIADGRFSATPVDGAQPLPGRFALPGLVDAHAHLALAPVAGGTIESVLASLHADRDAGVLLVVAAAACGWAGSSPRQTASEVISAATATTASTEGITAGTSPRPERWAPCRRAGVGEFMTGADGSAGQTSMPNRRADRARCRADRRRRRRLTSIGSVASASGRSISALSTW